MKLVFKVHKKYKKDVQYRSTQMPLFSTIDMTIGVALPAPRDSEPGVPLKTFD